MQKIYWKEVLAQEPDMKAYISYHTISLPGSEVATKQVIKVYIMSNIVLLLVREKSLTFKKM